MDLNLIFEAAYSNDTELLIKVITSGIDVNLEHPRSGHTPLQAACEADSLDAIRVLLENGANPNKRFTKVSRIDGREICSESVALMHVKSVNAAMLLIENGADIQIKDATGKSAVDWAKKDKNHKLVSFLKNQSKKIITSSHP